MNLVEKARSFKPEKVVKNVYSEDEFELLKELLLGNLTSRQVSEALGRGKNPGMVANWAFAQIKGALKVGKIILK